MNWLFVRLDALSVLGPQYGANVRAVTSRGLGVRYVRITDIDEFGRLRQDSVVEPDQGVSLRDYTLQSGDLLFARSGATVGKTYKHDVADGNCVFAGYLIRFRPDPRLVLPNYLKYYFQTSQYWSWVQSRKRTAAQPNINGAEYAALEVPLCSLSEQARIVELLDEADSLRRLGREADAKSVRILPSLFLKMFGEPVSNPKGWPEKPLSKVIKSVGAGWSARNESRAREGNEFGVLKVSAVTSGVFRAEEHKAVPQIEASRTLITPKKGDLLFSRANTRELVAATCIVDEDFPRLFLSDKLWRLTPVPGEASALFLKELFWQDGLRDRFRVASSGSSGSMLNIGQDAMLRTLAPIPPVEKQQHFERLAWRMMGVAKAAAVAASAIERTWSILLQQAFGGQLTAKWSEARIKELLTEMAQQARVLNLPLAQDSEALS